jgi:hypothetical protein
MRTLFRAAGATCAGLFAVLTMTGCSDPGPAMAPVAGVVTCEDRPVVHALVTFFPEGIPEARMAFAQTDEEGRFDALRSEHPGDGAAVGTHRVTVTESWGPGVEIPLTADGMQKSPPRGPWAARYRDSASSPLKVQVEAGKKNHIELKLTK